MIKIIGLFILLSTISMLSWSDDAAWGEVGGADLPATEQAPPVQTPEAPINEPACGEDDPRIENFVPVLQEIRAGNTIEPIQMTLETYISLSLKIRNMLGDNIYFSLPDCSKSYFFKGELLDVVEVPMITMWSTITDALRTSDVEKLQFMKKNIRPAPVTAAELISYIQDVEFSPEQRTMLEENLFITNIRNAPYRGGDNDWWSFLDIYIVLGGKLISGDIGKSIYLAEEISAFRREVITGVFLDDGQGSDRTPFYSTKKIYRTLFQLGLKPEVFEDSSIRDTKWYKMFRQLKSQ